MKKLTILLFSFLNLFMIQTAHSSISIVDLEGDIDGFGVGCPIANGLNYTDYGAYWADNRGVGDPSFTDYWYVGDRSWTHNYDLMGLTPVSASLELYVAGLVDNASWHADVLVNNVSIGTIPPETSENDLTRILTFNVPIGLLINPDGIKIDIDNPVDGYIVDYSKLTIQAIPAPGAIALCGIGAAFIGWFKRRRVL